MEEKVNVDSPGSKTLKFKMKIFSFFPDALGSSWEAVEVRKFSITR